MTQAVAKPWAKWMVPGLLAILIVAIATLAVFQFSQNSSLTSQVSTLQNQVNGLTNKVNNYQSLLNLTVATTWVNSLSLTLAPSSTTQLGNYTAGYAGYIHIVAALNNTACCSLKLTDSFYVGGLPSTYFFQSMQSTMDIPVLPGTISLSLINGTSGYQVGITIKIVYYS